MKVVRGLDALEPRWRGGVVTIGNFDGVHRGHVRLLARCAELAGARPVVVITFEPHPVAVLSPQRAPKRLTPLDEKLRRIESHGPQAVIVLHTDAGLLATPAEMFVERVLVLPLRPEVVVEGPTFGFGAGRAGTVETLRELGRRFGYAVEVVQPERIRLPGETGETVVSSSLIRRLVEAGRVEEAARCLARPFALVGSVVAGARMGRRLGYPTINVNSQEQVLPGDGVYAGRAEFERGVFDAAISVGARPTFDGPQRVVEAYLLGDVAARYGQRCRLEFVERLRDQRRFESPEALAAQIGRDVESVRAALGRERG